MECKAKTEKRKEVTNVILKKNSKIGRHQRNNNERNKHKSKRG